MDLLQKARAIANSDGIIEIVCHPNLLGSGFHRAFITDLLYDRVVWSGTPEELVAQQPTFTDHIAKYWPEDEDDHDEEVTTEQLVEEAYKLYNP